MFSSRLEERSRDIAIFLGTPKRQRGIRGISVATARKQKGEEDSSSSLFRKYILDRLAREKRKRWKYSEKEEELRSPSTVNSWIRRSNGRSGKKFYLGWRRSKKWPFLLECEEVFPLARFEFSCRIEAEDCTLCMSILLCNESTRGYDFRPFEQMVLKGNRRVYPIYLFLYHV